jgi:hypothetical protein
VDLGFNDPTSFTVLAWHPETTKSYLRRSYKQVGWTYTQVADEAKKLNETYHFDEWAIDGADKQGVEEMRKHHNAPWKAAQKQGKKDVIELMNADFISADILVDSVECKDLVEDYQNLIWTSDTKQVENPASHKYSHCADGALYAYRASRAFRGVAPKVLPKYGSPEFVAAQAQTLFKQQEMKAMENANNRNRISRVNAFTGPSAFRR